MSSYGAKEQLTTQESANLILQTPVMFKQPSSWSVVRLDFCLKENLRNGLYKPSEFLGKGQAKLIEISTLYDCDRVLEVNSSLKSIVITEDEERRYRVQDNDVLINRVSKRQEGVAQARIVRIISSWNQPVVFESNMLRARLDAEKIIPDFFSFYASTTSYLIQVLSKAQKGNQTSINQPALNSIILPLPPLPEQKTIAHTLRTIQKAKETRQRELELERERKAALMQYLFTHGTRNETRKQTEIGKIPESWEVVKLGEICSISTGTTPSTNKPEYYKGNIPFIKTAQIVNNKIYESDTYISEQAVLNYNLKIYPPKTVFMAMYGQGKTRGQVALLEIGAATTQNTAAIIPNYKIDSEFLWQYLMNQYEKLREAAHQGQISHLNLGLVKQYKIALTSPEEQIYITDILKNCDRKIQALEKEIALTDELFHAMLEQLMTGKISTQSLTETYV
ncbi:restriction endonuclease subunit S [Nostoc sp.]|uniref:restriction endonuclease subunit S n=1 Tax=Nostoc sp. TaxID=1180 RepID=UPI002FF8CADC